MTSEQLKIWLQLMLGPTMVMNPWFRFWIDAALRAEEQRLTSAKVGHRRK